MRPLLMSLAGLLVAAPVVDAQTPEASPVLQAMRAELERAKRNLGTQAVPPYYLSYQITEIATTSVMGSFGTIASSETYRRRALSVDVRVGSPAFDNTHQVRGGIPGMEMFLDLFEGMRPVPVDDDTEAIRSALWLQTDQRYRRAVQRMGWLRMNASLAVQPDDTSPDFSPEPPQRYYEPVVEAAVDRRTWEEKVRRYTLPFVGQPHIYEARCSIVATVQTKWFVNDEGTEVQTSQPTYRLTIYASTKAEDGMELPRYDSFMAATPGELPADSIVLAAVGRMIADLHALRLAPVIDPYTGPAILSGRASAVFFHEVFGHRIEGHRQKREDEGQTFKASVHSRVLPVNFSVISDPTRARQGNAELAGFYRFDDEGVPARRVTVVQSGILENFLMSRSPIEGFAHSNGHGRSQIGMTPVARQSNLIVQVNHPRTPAQLRRMLIDAINREHKPFGLFFDEIEGGFTITNREMPNAFEVIPVMVYRVWPDGRQELVRGVDFVGTPLTAFSRIMDGDSEVEVFNGMCEAESGAVPVAAVSPAVFIGQVEVQKKPRSTQRPPILAPPPERADSTGKP